MISILCLQLFSYIDLTNSSVLSLKNAISDAALRMFPSTSLIGYVSFLDDVGCWISNRLAMQLREEIMKWAILSWSLLYFI